MKNRLIDEAFDVEKMSLDELEALSYESFISHFYIYSSYNSAKRKGFEAHHVVPRCINPDSQECVRLTTYEHILAHYLGARDYGGVWLHAFDGVLTLRKHLSTIVKLEELKDFAELRRQGFGTHTYWKGRTGAFKGHHHSEESKQRNREAHLGVKKGPHSEERRKKIGDGNRGKVRTREMRDHMRDLMTPERREWYRQQHLGTHHTEEAKKKLSKARAIYNYHITKPDGEEIVVEDLLTWCFQEFPPTEDHPKRPYTARVEMTQEHNYHGYRTRKILKSEDSVLY